MHPYMINGFAKIDANGEFQCMYPKSYYDHNYGGTGYAIANIMILGNVKNDVLTIYKSKSHQVVFAASGHNQPVSAVGGGYIIINSILCMGLK